MKLILISMMVMLSYFPFLQDKKDDKDLMKQEIIEADIAMSDLAEKEGFIVALSKNASEDFVKLGEGSYPVIGKKEFDKKFEGKTGPKTLTWKPEKADVSESGDLGYTWGYWKFEMPDTTVYGNYFTVWKKQSEGIWKMELDGGNSVPGPKQ
ncbi:MAG TPA: nuclear transport factor 2 family protein [Ignavibacteria bacterium]|nr:nuclear transport factor 2 family protein [Ignavibacteria bacterium]HMR39958.1 nuclear transport factor 2 family protein [Ignavibacteria bacterium]